MLQFRHEHPQLLVAEFTDRLRRIINGESVERFDVFKFVQTLSRRFQDAFNPLSSTLKPIDLFDQFRIGFRGIFALDTVDYLVESGKQ